MVDTTPKQQTEPCDVDSPPDDQHAVEHDGDREVDDHQHEVRRAATIYKSPERGTERDESRDDEVHPELERIALGRIARAWLHDADAVNRLPAAARLTQSRY